MAFKLDKLKRNKRLPDSRSVSAEPELSLQITQLATPGPAAKNQAREVPEPRPTSAPGQEKKLTSLARKPLEKSDKVSDLPGVPQGNDDEGSGTGPLPSPAATRLLFYKSMKTNDGVEEILNRASTPPQQLQPLPNKVALKALDIPDDLPTPPHTPPLDSDRRSVKPKDPGSPNLAVPYEPDETEKATVSYMIEEVLTDLFSPKEAFFNSLLAEMKASIPPPDEGVDSVFMWTTETTTKGQSQPPAVTPVPTLSSGSPSLNGAATAAATSASGTSPRPLSSPRALRQQVANARDFPASSSTASVGAAVDITGSNDALSKLRMRQQKLEMSLDSLRHQIQT